MNKKWKRTVMGDAILDCGDFFISYRGNTRSVMGITAFAGDNGGAETALIKGNDYYILNGDFRKEYEKVADKGFEECVKFFNTKKEKHESSWSCHE